MTVYNRIINKYCNKAQLSAINYWGIGKSCGFLQLRVRVVNGYNNYNNNNRSFIPNSPISRWHMFGPRIYPSVRVRHRTKTGYLGVYPPIFSCLSYVILPCADYSKQRLIESNLIGGPTSLPTLNRVLIHFVPCFYYVFGLRE